MKTTTYITYTDGRPDEDFGSIAEAKEAIMQEWPRCEIGHDGDLSDGGDRTLCWACVEDSIDDDGARAVASIRRYQHESE